MLSCQFTQAQQAEIAKSLLLLLKVTRTLTLPQIFTIVFTLTFT